MGPAYPYSAAQRLLAERDPLVQRGLGRYGRGKIMSAATLLVILVVGLIAGWLAGQIVKGTGFGLVADIAIGIVGALSVVGFCPVWASTSAQGLSLPSLARPLARSSCSSFSD